MSLLTELREKCDGLFGQIETFRAKANDKTQDFTAEDEANFQRACDDYDATKQQLDDEQRKAQESAQNRDRLMARAEDAARGRESERQQRRQIGRDDFRQSGSGGRGEVTEEQRGLALRSWIISPRRELTDDERSACQRMGIDPYSREMEIPIGDTRMVNDVRAQFLQTRALSAQIGASGAYTIQEGMLQALEVAMIAFGGMRQTSTVIRTDTGAQIPYPTTDDTSNTGELIGENTAVSEQDVSFAAVNISAHQYSSKMVKVPVALLEDSAFNIPTLLGRLLGERLGRITNTHYTTGDGAAKPRGITTMTTLGKTTAGATAITMDEVQDLIDSVDEGYLPGSRFMFKRSTLTYLRKLKDGQGQYLWTRGTQAGEPDMIWGYPYTTNTAMSAIATGVKSMLFGQLDKYIIREVRSIRMRRLVERYAEYDQEAFLAFLRTDGVLIDAGAHPVKHMLQA